MKKKTSKKSMTLKKKILLIVVSIFLVAIISFFTGYGIYAYQLIKSVPAELTEEVAKQNQTYIKELYKEPLIQNLPYAITANEINLHAKSGILIDATTGWILYEKNADEVIPPASMTKVVLMYLALDALEKGQIKLTDKIDLPPESWAINAPPHSS
ncbi:MAG: serine hydrolase, partial [Treponemataceae bacterium]|nr:serine hydrolase [Treponemataceae bacterium]